MEFQNEKKKYHHPVSTWSGTILFIVMIAIVVISESLK